MPCQQPFRDDSQQLLLFKIASCLADGDFIAGVASFNGRNGNVTLEAADVIAALGCTPACEADTISQADGDARYVLKAGDTMTGSLNIANSAILVASDPALDITQTWNNGAVTFTGLQSNITNTASSTNSNLFNFQVDGVDRFNFTPGGSLRAVRQDASDSGMNLFLRKRGNAGSATGAVANDSTIGSVRYSGWDGTAFADGSRISGLASEAWTGIAHGSRIDLYTTPVGSTTEQLILRLSQTGQSQFLDGTAPLPSLTFQSDPDTGIYRIGANSLGISASGSAIFGVDTLGVNLTTALAYRYNSVNVIRAQTALNNFFFGPSGNLTMTGVNNLATGYEALFSNTTGANNVATGYQALYSNTTGLNNLANGFQALYSNTTGANNVATGYQALYFNTTASNNLANGFQALYSNTTGANNVATGYQALYFNTTGNNNLANGVQALYFNTTGLNNVATGYLALYSNTTGNNNLANGVQALYSNTTGLNNVATGIQALFSNTTASNNLANGFQALYSNTTGANNVATGYQALYFNTSGINLTANGYLALYSNTTGNNNLANGVQALYFNTTGVNNVANGVQALFSNTIGGSNLANGFQALYFNTTGNSNVATGYQALYSNTTGLNNVATGYQALFSNTTGGDNVADGYVTLYNLTTGMNNTGIGRNTGQGITTGSNNTIIGANVTGLAAALSNNIILADGAGVIRIQVASTGVVTIPIGLTLSTAAPLSMASGANQRAGNATLVAGTVTVANTSVTANTVVMLTRKTSGGTLGTAITYTVIAATSFTITSDSALDTSTFSYLLVEVP